MKGHIPASTPPDASLLKKGVLMAIQFINEKAHETVSLFIAGKF